MIIFVGLMIPLVGTTLGAAAVFMMKRDWEEKAEKFLLGFASGVMLAASVWSLLIPAIEMSGGYRLTFLPAAVGFAAGMAFLLVLDGAVRRLNGMRTREGRGSLLGRSAMTALAVTLHNIPEGMAVGVALSAAHDSGSAVTIASAAALSVGIAIQNFPEGAIISMPLLAQGCSKRRAFLIGTLSGAVEPVFGLVTVIVTGLVVSALPYLLSFAAGAMIFVVAQELLPEARTDSGAGTATPGLTAGFILMMCLDVGLK